MSQKNVMQENVFQKDTMQTDVMRENAFQKDTVQTDVVQENMCKKDEAQKKWYSWSNFRFGWSVIRFYVSLERPWSAVSEKTWH